MEAFSTHSGEEARFFCQIGDGVVVVKLQLHRVSVKGAPRCCLDQPTTTNSGCKNASIKLRHKNTNCYTCGNFFFVKKPDRLILQSFTLKSRWFKIKAIFFAFNSNRVQILWKGHKHLANYKWKIVPIFVAFSDYLDFSYALRQQNDVFKWKKNCNLYFWVFL